ncbi:MAG: hypothetical protein IJZ33_07275 [Clostridia bacterium]|nr:hypothetical protein [Clostridia bacterium]
MFDTGAMEWYTVSKKELIKEIRNEKNALFDSIACPFAFFALVRGH